MMQIRLRKLKRNILIDRSCICPSLWSMVTLGFFCRGGHGTPRAENVSVGSTASSTSIVAEKFRKTILLITTRSWGKGLEEIGAFCTSGRIERKKINRRPTFGRCDFEYRRICPYRYQLKILAERSRMCSRESIACWMTRRRFYLISWFYFEPRQLGTLISHSSADKIGSHVRSGVSTGDGLGPELMAPYHSQPLVSFICNPIKNHYITW